MRFAWLKIPVVLVLLLCLLFERTAAADEPLSWSRLMMDGEHKDDLKKYLAAIRIADTLPENDPRRHLTLHDAAVLCAWEDKELDLAEQLFKRDIALLEKISMDFPDIVSDCYELANVYEWYGRYEEAEQLLLRAASIRRKWKDLQSNDPFNAEIYTSLYTIYYVRGDDAKANDSKTQMLKSLDLWRTDKSRGECLFKMDNNLYKYATRCKEVAPAKRKHLLEMALDYSMQSAVCNRRLYGEWSGEIANIDVAGILMALGKYTEAERMLRVALKVSEEDLDKRRGYALPTLQRLATFLCPQHRIKEVEQLQNEYLAKVAEQFGTKSDIYIGELQRCGYWWHKYYPKLAKTRVEKERAITGAKSTNQ